MPTFAIETLGCKVNQYESEQIAALLRSRGFVEAASVERADLRIVNSCSVTIQAASKSRQVTRRMTRLPVLGSHRASPDLRTETHRPRVLVTGCWATSNGAEASRLNGVDGVLGHHDDVARQLDQFLSSWFADGSRQQPNSQPVEEPSYTHTESSPETVGNNGRIINVNQPAGELISKSKSSLREKVNLNPEIPGRIRLQTSVGTTRLPLLGERRSSLHQRAFLKIQDGCDAHCTYCIIPQLRPTLWSKPIDDVIEEATRMIDAGHIEIVLTGIFLGAYGQTTALRRRQSHDETPPLARLVEALCTRVPGLMRLRLSSLEPGDMSANLISVLRAHAQVVPHFHLPLQSGSGELLRRMNRQYTREDYLRMIDDVNDAFDRPALTTDIIVGFPGEDESEFEQTIDVVNRSRFIHIHAFSFSPRPGTAAARWSRDFVRGPVVNERIDRLGEMSEEYSVEFRRQFIGESVELLIEHSSDASEPPHGRCERYFDVVIESSDRSLNPGDRVRARVTRVSPRRTFATVADEEGDFSR